MPTFLTLLGIAEDFSALENVLLPLNFAKNEKPDRRELALRSAGMEQFAKKPVNKLSDGQKQCVAIARAIVNEPPLILTDEPTGALDTKTSAEIMEVFKTLDSGGKTIVIVILIVIQWTKVH